VSGIKNNNFLKKVWRKNKKLQKNKYKNKNNCCKYAKCKEKKRKQ